MRFDIDFQNLMLYSTLLAGGNLIMYKSIVQIEGMRCGMCEAHINDAIRKAVDPERVSSSCSRNRTVILSKEMLSEEVIQKTVNDTGYRFRSMEQKQYEKNGLFSFF